MQAISRLTLIANANYVWAYYMWLILMSKGKI
jgi:hypothetical protein